VGGAFVRTIHHFWPDLGRWMAELPDTRYQPFVTYDKAFLMWLGLGVFLFRLGARRQLDYELGGDPEQDEMVWAEFQTLKDLSPERVVRLTRPDGVVEEYRWVNDLLYTDASGREHQVAAIESVALRDGEPISTWAWLTNFRVSAKNAMAIANQGGRPRSTIENEGFNVQKNGGYRLEHAYSYDEVGLRVFYILLQIAHAMMPVFERGSLLKGLAIQVGKRTLLDWYGSYQNLSRRLLEFFRNRWIAAEAFDVEAARRIQIRFDSS